MGGGAPHQSVFAAVVCEVDVRSMLQKHAHDRCVSCSRSEVECNFNVAVLAQGELVRVFADLEKREDECAVAARARRCERRPMRRVR
jgi:hypothetical protein